MRGRTIREVTSTLTMERALNVASFIWQPGDGTRYDLALARLPMGGHLFSWNNARGGGTRAMVIPRGGWAPEPNYLEEKMHINDRYDAEILAKFLAEQLPLFCAERHWALLAQGDEVVDVRGAPQVLEVLETKADGASLQSDIGVVWSPLRHLQLVEQG